MTMEHFYLSIKNTQRKIEDVRNLFKNLTTQEKEILEFEKARAERLKLERDLLMTTAAELDAEVSHNSSLSSASPTSPSPAECKMPVLANRCVGVRRSQEIIIVENIKRDQADGSLAPRPLSSRHSTGSAGLDTTMPLSVGSLNCLENENNSMRNSKENFQVIQKSEIINFDKLNQHMQQQTDKHVNFLHAHKRREREEEFNPDAVKVHRKG